MKKQDKHEKQSDASFFEKYSLVIVWVCLIVLFAVLVPQNFFTWPNFSMMFSYKAVVVILSMGVMVPLIAGDFDMSAASTLTFCSMVVAVLNVRLGVPIGIAILAAMAVSAVVGCINGFLIAELNVNSFILTMAMGTVLNGLTQLICNHLTVTGVSRILPILTAQTKIMSISVIFFYALALTGILYYFFEYTAPGQRVLVVGRNRNVARLSGINVKRVRFLSFFSASLIYGVAGVLYCGMLSGADPTSGITFQLPAFSAVFLGSICIRPGRYNPIGTLIAVYFLQTGTNGLSLMGMNTSIQDIFNGGCLAVAVCLSILIAKRQEKRMNLIAKRELAQEAAAREEAASENNFRK